MSSFPLDSPRATMPYEPTTKERLEDLKPYIGPTIATLIVVAVITWVTWRQLSPAPRRVAADNAAEKMVGARATEAQTRSQAAEAEAQDALARGNRADALEKFRAALRWQQQANASQPNLAARDLPREGRLAAALMDIEAAPLRAAVELNRTLGTAAIAREQWDEALKALGEARQAQIELNRRFPGSTYADAAGLARIEADFAVADTNRLTLESLRREREAEQAVVAGDLARASAAFQEAANLQREINDKYAGNRFASPTRLEQLIARRDAAQPRKPGESK